MGALIELPLSMVVMAGWGAWLTAGLALVVWARRAREARLMTYARDSAARNIPRPKSGVRLPKPTPAPPDAFQELQILLDAPTVSGGRRPGD